MIKKQPVTSYYDMNLIKEIHQPAWPQVRSVRDGEAIQVDKVVQHPEKPDTLLVYVIAQAYKGIMPFEVTHEFVNYWKLEHGDFIIRLDEIHIGPEEFIESFMFVMKPREFHRTFNRIS